MLKPKLKIMNVLMESDICRLIFVHSVEGLGQSDQWRAEDKVVHLLCFPQSDQIFHIFLPATSE